MPSAGTPAADLRELMRNADHGTGAPGTNPMLVSSGQHLTGPVCTASQFYSAGSQAILDTYYDVGAWVSPVSQPALTEANVGVSSVFGAWCYQGSRPVVSNGRVYAAVGNRVVASDLTGNELWSFTHAPSVNWRLLNPPAVANDRLVLSGMDGTVMVVNGATGTIEHNWTLNYKFTHQPAVVNGRIYVGTSNGKLVAIDTGNTALTGWSQWGGGPGHNGQ
jgi:hypothetical protein